ncbi:unnamed protein product [Sphagnum tenellum]
MRISKTSLKNIVLSEFQVALRASKRVREEAHRETNSLHAYVGNVEAAAAGLLSCVQELEHLLTLSSIVKSGYSNMDAVRGRIATAATREVQKHAAQAAQAVAAAWEATMELGEVSTDDTQSSYYCSRARQMRSS